MEQMDPDDERRAALELYVRDLLTSLLRYQSADGRWYQVVNKGDQPVTGWKIPALAYMPRRWLALPAPD